MQTIHHRHATVLHSAILLSGLFYSEPTLAADGCLAPSFETARTFDGGFYPYFLTVGDLNGDGNDDLAVGHTVLEGVVTNVSVLLGNGDGTFQPAVNYGAGGNPSYLAVGDFNGDGNPD